MVKDDISNVFESEKEKANLKRLDSFYSLKKKIGIYIMLIQFLIKL